MKILRNITSLGRLKLRYVFVFLLLVLITWRLYGLYQPLPESAAYDNGAGKLFQDLQSSHLLHVEESDQRVDLPEPDYVLALETAASNQTNNQSKEEREKAQEYLDALYLKPVGQRVQQEVALWNHTRRFAAVRDDAPNEADDKNRWEVHVQGGGNVNTRAIVPLGFGYINGDTLPSGYHDWKSASHPSQQLTFTRTFLSSGQPHKVNVQVIGQVDTSQLRVKYDLEPRTGNCPTQNQVSLITLQLPAGKKAITVELPISTAANPEPETQGLALRLQPPQTSQANKTECLPDLAGMTLVWSNESPAVAIANTTLVDSADTYVKATNQTRQASGKPIPIVTRDGIALGEQQSATKSAYDLGLLALIGEDAQDVYSLNGVLAQSSLPDDTPVVLTLDSQWQKIAQDTLHQRPNPKAGQKAALVVLNPKSGAILAAASTPTPPADVHPWDRASFSLQYPNHDPFQFLPWQMATPPGSTFKLVTAMAALNAAADNADLQQVLSGHLSPAAAAAKLGMKANEGTWQPPYDPKDVPLVHNAENNESLDAISQKPLFITECGRDAHATGKVGLQEATSESLNTWFAATALLMDKANLPENTKDASKTHLLQTAQRLGFGYYTDLLQGVEGYHRRYPANGGRGDVLNATGGRLDLADTRVNEQGYLILGSFPNRLIRNSFGQSITASPLQMAKVAATVAIGEPPLLHLLQQADDAEMATEKINSSDNFNLLRSSMKAVTEGGTAAGKFKDKLECRVYAKTGTATAPEPSGKYSSWLVGWLADDQTQPQVAFACVVTATDQFGADVCAPLVNQLLVQAEHKGLKP